MVIFASCSKTAYIVMLCAVFCFEWSTQDKMHIVIQTKSVLGLRQQAEICEKETGVPAATLKKIIDWPLADDRPTKEFFFCVVHNTGFVDKDGHFTDVFLNLHLENGTKDQLEHAVNECNKVTLEDGVETNYAMGDCIHKYCHFSVGS